jgi:RecJ-like exonuclease
MTKQNLLKIALCLSLIGLFILVVISYYYEPEETKIILTQDKFGSHVLIRGEITKITHKENITAFNLKDETGKIKVVAFGNASKLTLNSMIIVYGEVDTYNNELEIISREIKRQ